MADVNNSHYAVVAYLRGPLGRFVEDLRKGLYPEHAHLAAHVTVLPPRASTGTEADITAQLRNAAQKFAAFKMELGDVESFAPTTPTVFIQVKNGAHRFRDMHVAFNSGALQAEEPWPFMPHLTIVKMPDLALAHSALLTARQHWASHPGHRSAEIRELTFVREAEDSRWIDVATILLKEA